MLGGGEKFTKLDLSHAYQQLVLSPESCSLLAINTYQGLFHSTKLQFGVHSTSGIFQREIENLLKPVPFVKNDEEHLKNLENVVKFISNN